MIRPPIESCDARRLELPPLPSRVPDWVKLGGCIAAVAVGLLLFSYSINWLRF